MKIIKFYYKILILLFIVFSGCNQEVSVTRPDALPPDGFLFIDSNPQGAQIYVNNKFTRRVTPDSIKFLATNSYNITLKKEYFRDTSFVAEVTEGKKSNLLIDYTQNPLMRGKIVCNVKPDGSLIFLNGVSSGKVTPAVLDTLFPGNYNIRFHSVNFRDDSLLATVKSSVVLEVHKVLVDTTVWGDFTSNSSPIRTNKLTALAIDKNDALWIGTEDKGLTKFNGVNWKYYQYGSSAIQNSEVVCIYIESDGTVWTGNQLGLFIIYPSGAQEYFNNDTFRPLLDQNITSISYNPLHGILIASKSILIRYNKLDFMMPWNTISEFPLANSFNDTFNKIVSDNNDVIFIGTTSSGFYSQINDGTSAGTLFNTSNSAILSNKISALAQSPLGGVWVGFVGKPFLGSGLSYFDGSDFHSHLIIGVGETTNTIYIDQNDVKWVGTDKGLYEFTTDSDVKLYNYETTGLNLENVRGIVKDKIDRIWIATYGGGLIVKKK